MSAIIALIIAVLVGSILAEHNATISSATQPTNGTMKDAGTLTSTLLTTTTLCPLADSGMAAGTAYMTTLFTTQVFTITSCQSACLPSMANTSGLFASLAPSTGPLSTRLIATITVPAPVVQSLTLFSTQVGSKTRFIPMSSPVTTTNSKTFYTTWLSVSSWATTSTMSSTGVQTIHPPPTESCPKDMVCMTVTASTEAASAMPIISVTLGTNTPFKPGFRPTWTAGHAHGPGPEVVTVAATGSPHGTIGSTGSPVLGTASNHVFTSAIAPSGYHYNTSVASGHRVHTL